MPRLLLLAALLLTAAGCDSNDADAVGVDLRAGATSRYAVTLTRERADSPATEFSGETTIRVEADDETAAGSAGLSRLALVSSTESPNGVVVLRSTAWYRQREGRLEEVAYASGPGLGAVGLKRGATPWADLLTPFGGVAGTDSTVVGRTPPRIVVDYEAEDGGTWRHFETGGITSDRRRLGARTVSTPAGRFACVDVETTYGSGEGDSGIVWVDCIGEPGVVERTIQSAGGIDVGGAAATVTERWVLTAYTPGVAAKR